MPRICSAPSEARAAGGAGAAAFAGTVLERRERLRAMRTSAESSPENKRLKKARNANRIRFNSMAPRFKDSKWDRPSPFVVCRGWHGKNADRRQKTFCGQIGRASCRER